MNKQDALRILIEKSSFSQDDKNKMLAEVDSLNEEQIKELAQALVAQKSQEVAAVNNAITQLNELIETEPPDAERE